MMKFNPRLPSKESLTILRSAWGQRLVDMVQWTRRAVGRLDWQDRRWWWGVGGVLVATVVGLVVYSILNPRVIVQPDYRPFASQEEYDQFVTDNPLLVAGVPEGKKFNVESRIRDDKQAQYVITLSQKPLKPTMDKAYVQGYLDYLQHSQNEAKDWIRNQGLNPDELSIIWQPDVIEMRGKLLGESTKPADITIPLGGQSPDTIPSQKPTPTPTASSTPVNTPNGRFPE